MKKWNAILGVSIAMVLTLTAMLLPVAASACCGTKPINLNVTDNSPPGVECCTDLVITATWNVTYDDDYGPPWIQNYDTGIEVKIYDTNGDLVAECIETVASNQPEGAINQTTYEYTCAKHLPVGDYTYTVMVWSTDWADPRNEASIVGGEAIVVDTTPPELIGCPDDITLECTDEVPDPVEVTATDTCDPNPTVTLWETITLGDCTQEYTITRTWVATDASGNESTCTQVIMVVDETPPEVWCEEAVNPAGKNVPPAGSTTLPGPKGGKNEDGFYMLLARDNCDPEPKIWVGCEGCYQQYPEILPFGPFESGTVVKFTEAPGKAPSIKKMGSTNGNAGAVAWHITLPSEPRFGAIDACGNRADASLCFVPPPPK